MKGKNGSLCKLKETASAEKICGMSEKNALSR